MSRVAIQSLNKTFARHRALKNVSVVIEPGEMVAQIGASGSGKSTLIRHVSGLITADEKSGGGVLVDGRTMQSDGRMSAQAGQLRRDIGVVFQQFNLVSRLSVLTNVLTGLLGRVPRLRGTLGLFSRAEKLIAMRALARVGIAQTAAQRASTLSGGQQQRAAIARTLVQGARLVLADEPIASLDPASSRRVMEILAQINREDGITVMVSLHQVEYARRYCPRTIALRDGEVAYDGPSERLDMAFLKDIYGEASEELILPDAPIRPTQPVRVGPPRPALANA